MPDPLSPSTMQDFRDALGVNGAPSFFESTTSPVPVAIMGGNPGIAKPRANQRMRYVTVRSDGTSRQYQIGTVTSSKKVYFIGIQWNNNLAVAANATLFDATSGTGPSVATANQYQDELGWLQNFVTAAVANDKGQYNLPYPLQVKQGIRLTSGGAGQDCTFIITYLEEDVVY